MVSWMAKIVEGDDGLEEGAHWVTDSESLTSSRVGSIEVEDVSRLT
jgi:hypothetical protein